MWSMLAEKQPRSVTCLWRISFFVKHSSIRKLMLKANFRQTYPSKIIAMIYYYNGINQKICLFMTGPIRNLHFCITQNCRLLIDQNNAGFWLVNLVSLTLQIFLNPGLFLLHLWSNLKYRFRNLIESLLENEKTIIESKLFMLLEFKYLFKFSFLFTKCKS